MNRGWAKILIAFAVFAAVILYVGWPREMPLPQEINRARSPSGMSMILPPEWEAVALAADTTLDDGLKLRPIADGKLQPSIIVRRHIAAPDRDELTSNTFPTIESQPFRGKPVWYSKGVTRSEYLHRFVFDENGRWFQVTLSTPGPIDYPGSDWQRYLETFSSADAPASAPGAASTAPVLAPPASAPQRSAPPATAKTLES